MSQMTRGSGPRFRDPGSSRTLNAENPRTVEGRGIGGKLCVPHTPTTREGTPVQS